jgi:UDP-N-acetylmuramyl-tripeptide synthetase
MNYKLLALLNKLCHYRNMTFDLTGITHIAQDSRSVRPGSLFIALKGAKNDGMHYIPQAESLGAVAVLCAADAVLPETKMRILRAENPRLALSQIAAQFTPAQPAQMVAVTGTDGKTSTADFFRQLTHLCGHASASIGTLGAIGGDGKTLHAATHTTPGAVELHQMLAELAAKGITHACLEASSHGLDQYRLHGVRLVAAAFTNIARDHLDYHENEQKYFEAKAKLFSEVLPQGAVAVINADDKRAAELRNICAARGHKLVDFGTNADALKLLSLKPTAHGQEMRCRLFGVEYDVNIPLVGAFQAMNILAAIGLAHAAGIALEALVEAVPKLQGVPGRLQLAATTPNGAAIYVDYAHTPAALANILNTLRPHTQNKLHVVFGCGGNRDAGKRAEMGKIACALADKIIVTDDNPRDENPATIRAAILSACGRAQEVAERVKAIYVAVHALDFGDVLVIAGKGHEKTQIIGSVEHAHDDVLVAKEAVGKE